MRIACWWNRRKLAVDTVLGREPSGHAASCAQCREEWWRLAELAAALPGALCVPTPSEAFSEIVLPRLGSTAAHRRRLAPVYVLAAIVMCACAVWFAMRPAPAPDPRLIVHKPSIPPLQPANVTPTKAKEPERVVSAPKKEAPPVKQHKPYRRPIVASVKRNSGPANVAKVEWSQLAAYYEQMGYYPEASEAYARAYAEKKDPGLAYSAACAAESAGDVSTAVSYYSEVLGKGSEPGEGPG